MALKKMFGRPTYVRSLDFPRYRSHNVPSKSNNRSFLFNLGSFLYKKEGQAARSVYLSHTDRLAITFLPIDTSANRLHEADSPTAIEERVYKIYKCAI